MTWGGFNWKLNFRWYRVPQREMERRNGDKSEPVRFVLFFQFNLIIKLLSPHLTVFFLDHWTIKLNHSFPFFYRLVLDFMC